MERSDSPHTNTKTICEMLVLGERFLSSDLLVGMRF